MGQIKVEKMSYKALGEDLHFLNWIEQDGFTMKTLMKEFQN